MQLQHVVFKGSAEVPRRPTRGAPVKLLEIPIRCRDFETELDWRNAVAKRTRRRSWLRPLRGSSAGCGTSHNTGGARDTRPTNKPAIAVGTATKCTALTAGSR